MLRLKELKSRLEELTTFVSSKDSFSKEELYTWLTECVAFFSYMGVNEIIIKTFVDAFKPVNNSHSLSSSMFDDPVRIGPFEKSNGSYDYKLAKDFIGRTKIEDTYPLLMAFRTTEYLIEQKADEERLVSKSLIHILAENEAYSHITSLLNDLQRAYQNKDADKLNTVSLALLESILNLEPTIKLKRNISEKLRVLLSDNVVKKKFGVQNEFVVALDNSRIIRNIKSVHKNIPMKYNTPFLVGLSSAYLVLSFLEIAISTGNFDLS